MKKLLFNPIFLVLITFFSVLIIISLNKTSQKAFTAQKNLNKVETEISYLEQELENNKRELYQTKTDLNKEKIIRNELLMKKEGEIIVNLPLKEESEIVTLQNEKTTAWEEWKKVLRWKKAVK